ncbi:gamma-glutamyltransferase family protein [Rathayibacter soli]|uniref:gamma-glutamyltransferase family protein n=1 Tax=Rathayibacter soli TaxID=3144168 RepID=UPI0039083095
MSTRPELIGSFGMAASTHWLASAVAMSILERGGNAADAAVAGGFVLQVVEPHLNGPGGDAPILVWSESDRAVSVICGQGVAPAAASIERMLALGVEAIPGTGMLPAVVPGAFDAWLTLLERHGTMTLRQVLEPAIHYADDGHPLLPSAAATIARVEALFRGEWTTSAALWLPDGHVPQPGARVRNRALAATFRRVLAEAESAGTSRQAQIDGARRSWYQGFVAEAIERFVANTEVMDATGSRHRGLLTGDDLASWHATIESPVSFAYGRYTVFKTQTWGQGPVFLQQLALLEATDLSETEPGSADWIHTIVEAGKLAFADREAWYGDPQFTDVPLTDLLSPEYNAQRRILITADASLELRPGSPGGRAVRMPPLPASADHGWKTTDEVRIGGAAAGLGEPTVAPDGITRGDTCHIDVVDAAGMMISATPSGGWLQSSPTIPSLGFCLGTRGQMFWLQHGLANSLRPGARPRTTLSPSFALRDGEPWMAFGTPGGDSQDQWSLQFFLSLVHGGRNLQETIDAPAFHSDHAPDSFAPRASHPGQLVVESRIGADVIEDLRRRGHRVVVGPPWSEGRLSVVARDGGWLKAAANSRGNQGYAVGR